MKTTNHLNTYLKGQDLRYNKTRRSIFIGVRPMTNEDVTRFVLETAVNGRTLKRSIVFNAVRIEASQHPYSEINKQNL